jgi:hypothetical protein
LFGDFVERNNIMNVFGHLLKRDRGERINSKENSKIQNNDKNVSYPRMNEISRYLMSITDEILNL